MTILEFFDQGHALAGVKLGLISTSYLVKYDIYKTYIELTKKYTVQEARKKIMIRYAIDKVTVTRAISVFQKPFHTFATNGNGKPLLLK